MTTLMLQITPLSFRDATTCLSGIYTLTMATKTFVSRQNVSSVSVYAPPALVRTIKPLDAAPDTVTTLSIWTHSSTLIFTTNKSKKNTTVNTRRRIPVVAAQTM